MGQSFFLDNRGLRVAQLCLLAFCILLCLKPGVDAIECKSCISKNPGEPCEPSDGKCTGDICVLGEIFSENGDVIQSYKECGPEESKELCGKEWKLENKEKISCCETDLCYE